MKMHNRGGRRKGAGRKATDGANDCAWASVGLEDWMWDLVDQQEGGSVSERLRNLIRAYAGRGDVANVRKSPGVSKLKKRFSGDD